MKLKITFVISIIITILFTGCGSTNPWAQAKIPYQEANGWKSIGVSPYSATQFRANGYTMYDIKPWIQSGIRSPKAIMSWQNAGFTPQETNAYLKKGYNLNFAKKMKKDGFSLN